MSCMVVVLSELFRVGLGEWGTLAGDVRDESETLRVLYVLRGLRVILLDMCGALDLLHFRVIGVGNCSGRSEDPAAFLGGFG